MSAIYKNGIAYGGAASAANLISATDAEGSATNVQAQLDTINENITSLNDDLTNYIPYYIREVVINKSYTINAHTGLNIGSDLDAVVPLDGYTFIYPLGGKGNGDVGLVVSAGSGWIFNASATTKTFTSVTIYVLYRKNI